MPVTSVNALSNIRILNLSGTNVTDVNALKRVNTLYLSYSNVTDVLRLDSVYEIEMENAPIIVSMLKNLHILHINNKRLLIK